MRGVNVDNRGLVRWRDRVLRWKTVAFGRIVNFLLAKFRTQLSLTPTVHSLVSDSHTHLSRLKNWGFTFIRLIVPWEALEHSGPGQIDQSYLEYLHDLISLFLPRYGMKCYIDAHQDVWSRHTGGSGAPTWTLQLVGLDIRALKSTGAAHAHNLHLDTNKDPPPKVWPAGMTKLGAATMATVFWGGEIFCPKRKVKRRLHRGDWGNAGSEDELVGLQIFLQECMIEAFGKLADWLSDCEAVMGFEVSCLFALSVNDWLNLVGAGHQRATSRLYLVAFTSCVSQLMLSQYSPFGSDHLDYARKQMGLDSRSRHRLLPKRYSIMGTWYKSCGGNSSLCPSFPRHRRLSSCPAISTEASSSMVTSALDSRLLATFPNYDNSCTAE